MAAPLPSFVELMASLGLSERPAPTSQQAEGIPSPIAPESPSIESNAIPARSSSNPSLREAATRHHVARYSPYSPTAPFTKRRGSHSSSSSSDFESSPSDFESSPMSPIFAFPPHRTPSRTRRYRHKVNTSASSSDLTFDTPISTYVRRKTPGTSPVSPTFDSGYESASPSPILMPFSIPSLPVLSLPVFLNSESSPNSPTSDSESEMANDRNYYRFIHQRTGTRLSAPSRSARPDHLPRRKSVFN